MSEHKKKRIYIAYSGGTIGIQASDKGFVPVAEFLTKKLANLREFVRPHMTELTLSEYEGLID